MAETGSGRAVASSQGGMGRCGVGRWSTEPGRGYPATQGRGEEKCRVRENEVKMVTCNGTAVTCNHGVPRGPEGEPNDQSRL